MGEAGCGDWSAAINLRAAATDKSVDKDIVVRPLVGNHTTVSAFPTGFCNIYVITPIMVKGGAKIPGVDGMGGPGATEGGFFMYQHYGSRGSHRGSIEVVESVEEGVGRKFCVEARGAE